jgi:hypothetical protein
MNLTRDIVVDLLPVYAAGEASADTRAAVEQFADRDPVVRKLLSELDGVVTAASAPVLPPSLELAIVDRTRRTIRRRSWTLAMAIFFTLLPLTVAGRGGEVTFFMLRDQPESAWFWLLAAPLWAYYARATERLNAIWRSQ